MTKSADDATIRFVKVWRRLRLAAVAGAMASLGLICDGGASIEEACQHSCECIYFFPSDQQVCTDNCVDTLGGVSEECVTCLADAECEDIVDGNACLDECPWIWAPLE